jgi:hypothetical protein
MRKIYHLRIKSLESDYYFGDLTILYKLWGHFLDVSKSTLEKYDFKEPYDKGNFTIKKSVIQLSTRRKVNRETPTLTVTTEIESK